MLAQERQQIIMDMLAVNRSVKTSEIVERFQISTLTARRDLDVLEKRKLVRRVYGGAVLSAGSAAAFCDSAPVLLREAEKDSENRYRAIARLAASMVEEHDILFLGNGQLVGQIARNLHHFSHLTIITSSLLVVNEMAGTSNNLIVLGGMLGPDEPSIHGDTAVQMLRGYCADKAFISCVGVCADFGVTSDFSPTALIGRVMVEQAAHPMLVCTSSKCGFHTLNVVCPVSRLDAIITDDGIDPVQREALTDAGTTVYVTPKQGRHTCEQAAGAEEAASS